LEGFALGSLTERYVGDELIKEAVGNIVGLILEVELDRENLLIGDKEAVFDGRFVGSFEGLAALETAWLINSNGGKIVGKLVGILIFGFGEGDGLLVVVFVLKTDGG
jgi:hypothetical protein